MIYYTSIQFTQARNFRLLHFPGLASDSEAVRCTAKPQASKAPCRVTQETR